MNARTLRVLEYDKVVKRLINEASTTIGKELTREIKPLTNLSDVKTLQNETDEALRIINLNKVIPFGGIVDIRQSLKRSKIESILRTNDCLDVSTTIYGGRQVKTFIEKLEIDLPLLKKHVDPISSLRELEREINRCIDDHGEIVDSATEKLRGIRSSIRTLESRIRERLNQYTKTKSKMLSDTIVTIRNDRYVIPVKHEYRAAIGGIVHDQSASGQTLFMEPKAIVELNNRLHEMTLKEKQEIEQILKHLTKHIADDADALTINIQALAMVDFIFARAQLAFKMKAAMPKLNDQGFIKMQQARHPLIPFEEAVANDIEIGKDYTAIVITGPNTGGKTVTLKMIGLCTLMAQSGLQIPAFDGCELAVFERVFADIGDEQSIEQNLSTFSSHMTNIVDIMKHVNDKTLVLFDEIGAGTDPQEGAALAMSILDEVINRDARVIATTHYPELKAYGYNRKHVMNASVEFDVETLKPTYRLLMGVPGRSNAFEISKRLGLESNIIEQAKSHIGIDSKNVENMIEALETSKREAEKEYAKAHDILIASEKLHQDLEKEWNDFLNKRQRLFEKAEVKAEKALKKAKEDAEFIVAEVRQMKDRAMWKEHEWIDAKKILDEAQPELTKEETTELERPVETLSNLTPGDSIILTSVNQEGTVLEKVSEKEYLVQVGMMKVKANRKDLKQIDKKEQTEEHKPTPTIRTTKSHVKTELDLRGERYEDALLQLEKYIDDALVAGYPRVSVIHGKGTGALRQAVQQFVQTHPHISSARLGGMNEGGSGVTIIELN